MTIEKTMEIAQYYCWKKFKVSSNPHAKTRVKFIIVSSYRGNPTKLPPTAIFKVKLMWPCYNTNYRTRTV